MIRTTRAAAHQQACKVKELKKQGFIDQPGVQSRHFETDGDEEIIYLTYKGRPEGELRRES